MRRLLLLFIAVAACLGDRASAHSRAQCGPLLQIERKMYARRLPVKKRVEVAREARDLLLTHLDEARVPWVPTEENDRRFERNIPGFRILPDIKGGALNAFAKQIEETYGAPYEFDLELLASLSAGAAALDDVQAPLLLGAVRSLIFLEPAWYERHEVDHLEMIRRRKIGTPSVFHGRITHFEKTSDMHIRGYERPSFEELFCHARDMAFGAQHAGTARQWIVLGKSSRLLRRFSHRIGEVARAAQRQLEKSDTRTLVIWNSVAREVSTRYPTVRLENSLGHPEMDFPDYGEPSMLLESRYPEERVSRATQVLLSHAVRASRPYDVALADMQKFPTGEWKTGRLFQSPNVRFEVRKAWWGMVGHPIVRIWVRVDGRERYFDASHEYSARYLDVIHYGFETYSPQTRCRWRGRLKEVASARFGQLADLCDALEPELQGIADAIAEGDFNAAVDKAPRLGELVEAADRNL